jgi:hypothetical protein
MKTSLYSIILLFVLSFSALANIDENPPPAPAPDISVAIEAWEMCVLSVTYMFVDAYTTQPIVLRPDVLGRQLAKMQWQNCGNRPSEPEIVPIEPSI